MLLPPPPLAPVLALLDDVAPPALLELLPGPLVVALVFPVPVELESSVPQATVTLQAKKPIAVHCQFMHPRILHVARRPNAVYILGMIRRAAWMGAVLLFMARSAAANGAFPTAGQIAVDPVDPNHIVARATFGIVRTVDAGRTWDWICESGAGYVDEHPPLAIAADGSIFGGMSVGVTVSHDGGCNWQFATGLIVTTPDVSTRRGDPTFGLAVSADVATSTSRYWESTDGAASFAAVGAPMPAGFL